MRFFKFYQKLILGMFLIFYLKLQQHTVALNWLKEFLRKRILFWSFGTKFGWKWTLNENFQVLSKNKARDFSDFLHEVTTAWWFKSDLKDFLGEIFWAKKWPEAQNKAFWVLWKIVSKIFHSLAWNYSSEKT